ncbi:MAG: lytic transglycosylase domain-containing protein, partial [Bryobacteraceae bacterium]
LAFPFPYRDLIRREARKHGVDPLLVAALIRQESEFDPGAVSPSGAIGLMQIMPATGRELGKRLRMRPVTRRALHNPGLNVRLGVYHLARLLQERKGSREEALAAYNAGLTPIPLWAGWGDFREPAEFVETIPLQQTRDYVQIILRNLEFYRWLYGTAPTPARSAAGAAARPAARPKSLPAKRPRNSSDPRGAKSVAGKR